MENNKKLEMVGKVSFNEHFGYSWHEVRELSAFLDNLQEGTKVKVSIEVIED